MSAPDLLFEFGETSLAVAALIALVLIIRRPFARVFGARAAYALWLAPTVRLFLPELNILQAPTLMESASYTATGVITTAPEITAQPIDWVGLGAAIALFLWFAVAVAWIAMRFEHQRLATRRAFASSAPAPETLRRQAANITNELGLRRRPVLRLYSDETGPTVMGLVRPVVFLPASFETAYTADERRLALAHEFAHIARGDLIASFAATVLQAVQWPNPFVHLAVRAFRTDQEAACDAFVLARCGGGNAAGDYASAIMKSVRGSAPAYGLSLGHPLKERLMLLKRSRSSLTRRLVGGAGAAALIAAGLAATASYGYAPAEDAENHVIIEQDPAVDDSDVVVEKKVLIFSGSEDEVIFDDVAVGDRVQVLEFEAGDGRKRVIEVKGSEKVVRVIGDNGEVITEDRLHEGDPHNMTSSTCVAGDDEGEPVILEWKNESGDAKNKRVEHTVICLTGVDAEPENRAEAMRKAIDQLEENAKEQEARRKEMIKSLRQQAKEIEKQN